MSTIERGEKILKFKLNAKVFNELAKHNKLPISRQADGSFKIVLNDKLIHLQPTVIQRTTAIYKKDASKLNYVGEAVEARMDIRAKPITQEKSPQDTTIPKRSSKPEETKKSRQTQLIDIETAVAIDKSISDAQKKKPPIKKGKRPETKSSEQKSKTSENKIMEHKATEALRESPSAYEDQKRDESARSKQSSRTSSSYLSLSPEHKPAKKKQEESLNEIVPAEPDKSLYDCVRYQLALGAFTLPFLSKTFKASVEEIEAIAFKVGIHLNNPRDSYCLKPQLYTKLNIRDWPRYSDAERAEATKNANEAQQLLAAAKTGSTPDGLNNKSSSQKGALAIKKRSKIEEQHRRMLNPSKRGTSATSKPKSKPNMPSKTEINKRQSSSPFQQDIRSDTESEPVKKAVKSMSEHTPIPDKLLAEVPPSPTNTLATLQTYFYNIAKITDQKKFDAFCKKYILEQRAQEELKLEITRHEHYNAFKEHRSKRKAGTRLLHANSH
ncbi:hypothetical protein BY458DRAFT_547012 [Sporodiniella umbellata]|nr:hypothetical protein BY458DRAFT_547012 [Sporodiniella umbellata]